MTDLFGQQPQQIKNLHAYGGTPGMGPPGKVCRGCRYFVRLHFSKAYFKCALVEEIWTRGSGTDIRAMMPACEKFKSL